MSDTAPPADWKTGLEQVAACPHCGVPVYVRVADKNAITGLPQPVYLCACRTLSVWKVAPGPWTSWPEPPAPPAQPARPWGPAPTVPLTPAIPATPWVPYTPSQPYYEDPTHPGLPPYINCGSSGRTP